MAVASLIGVIPIYLVSVLFQRWLVSGLANRFLIVSGELQKLNAPSHSFTLVSGLRLG